jgi:hypothetical protein
MCSGYVVSYLTERMLNQSGNQPGEKMPDVVWVTQSGQSIGVEIELSAKWGRDLGHFTLGIIQALASSEGKPPRFNRFAIITDSAAIYDRYIDAFKPGKGLPIWKKNKRQHWVIDKTVEVPGWVSTKIDFQLLER